MAAGTLKEARARKAQLLAENMGLRTALAQESRALQEPAQWFEVAYLSLQMSSRLRRCLHSRNGKPPSFLRKVYCFIRCSL